jgi:hypothetical protein
MSAVPLESRVISWSTAAVAVVLAVCLCILIIAATLFGIAEFRAHWP